MRLSCRFIPIEEVNQKSPQMTLIRLKTRHFRTQRNILYRKNSLIYQGYVVDRFPTLCQWRFTSFNFNHNLLVAPTFVERRKLICTPDISLLKYHSKTEMLLAIKFDQRDFLIRCRKGKLLLQHLHFRTPNSISFDNNNISYMYSKLMNSFYFRLLTLEIKDIYIPGSVTSHSHTTPSCKLDVKTLAYRFPTISYP